MSDSVTYPAEGVDHLIIEQMGRDAQLVGVSDIAVIEVIRQPGQEDTTGAFTTEGGVVCFQGATAVRAILPTGMSVTVKNASGDLRVQHLAGDVNLENVRGDLRLTELPGVVRVAQVEADVRARGTEDLRLMGSCNGDLRFENGKRLAAEAVAGDVRLHNAGEIRLGHVRGDLWADKVRDILQVSRVDGDARLAKIVGSVTLRAVAGDLRAEALTGGLSAPDVCGDALLEGPFGATASYTLSAEGDISLNLPAEPNVRLSVIAGRRIRSDPQLTPAADGSGAFTATLGDGTIRINLSSGSDLRIAQDGSTTARTGRETRGKTFCDPSGDLSDLGEHIRQQVSTCLAAAGINIETGKLNWSRRERVRSGKESRAPRQSATERPRPPSAPPAPSLDEQIAVLRMVEEGKITPEEADVLLKALGA